MYLTADRSDLAGFLLVALVLFSAPLVACGDNPHCDESDEEVCEEEPDEPDQPDPSEQTDDPEQTDEPDDSDQPDQSDESDDSDQSDQPDESDEPDQPDEPDEPEPCEVCWDLEQAQFATDLDVSEATRDPRSMQFHPNGDRLFLMSRGPREVIEYQLDSPWDLEDATVVDIFDVQEESLTHPHGLYLRKSDGAMMWIFSRRDIYEYTLSTPWAISSAELTYHLDLSDIIERGHDIDFSPDGDRLFIDDRRHEHIAEFSLDPHWDISSAELVDTLDISEIQEQVRGLEFHPDGNTFFLVDTRRRDLLEFSTPTPWRVDGAEFVRAFNLWDRSDDPRAITWKPDGSTFFVTDNEDQVLFQYILEE